MIDGLVIGLWFALIVAALVAPGIRTRRKGKKPS